VRTGSHATDDDRCEALHERKQAPTRKHVLGWCRWHDVRLLTVTLRGFFVGASGLGAFEKDGNGPGTTRWEICFRKFPMVWPARVVLWGNVYSECGESPAKYDQRIPRESGLRGQPCTKCGNCGERKETSRPSFLLAGKAGAPGASDHAASQPNPSRLERFKNEARDDTDYSAYQAVPHRVEVESGAKDDPMYWLPETFHDPLVQTTFHPRVVRRREAGYMRRSPRTQSAINWNAQGRSGPDPFPSDGRVIRGRRVIGIDGARSGTPAGSRSRRLNRRIAAWRLWCDARRAGGLAGVQAAGGHRAGGRTEVLQAPMWWERRATMKLLSATSAPFRKV